MNLSAIRSSAAFSEHPASERQWDFLESLASVGQHDHATALRLRGGDIAAQAFVSTPASLVKRKLTHNICELSFHNKQLIAQTLFGLSDFAEFRSPHRRSRYRGLLRGGGCRPLRAFKGSDLDSFQIPNTLRMFVLPHLGHFFNCRLQIMNSQ